jgi:hypothetical protein
MYPVLVAVSVLTTRLLTEQRKNLSKYMSCGICQDKPTTKVSLRINGKIRNFKVPCPKCNPKESKKHIKQIRKNWKNIR